MNTKNYKTMLLIVAVLFLTVIFPYKLVAQTTHRVNGYVTYSTTSTWATAAEVTLYDSEDQIVGTTCINANHYYNFSGIADGNYTIKVTKAIAWPSGTELKHSPSFSITVSGADYHKDMCANLSMPIPVHCISSSCTGCPNYE